MADYKFSKKDLETFKENGFEIHKLSNGEYYIVHIIATAFSIENAQKLGFTLTPNLKIISYK